MIVVPCKNGEWDFEGFVSAATGREWWVRAAAAAADGDTVVRAELTDAATGRPVRAASAVTLLGDLTHRPLPLADFRAELSHAAEMAEKDDDCDDDCSAVGGTAFLGVGNVAALLADIEEIGAGRFLGVSGRCVSFGVSDARGRLHKLRATLPVAYPLAPARVRVASSLEQSAGQQMLRSQQKRQPFLLAPARLPQLFKEFAKEVDAMQPLWNELEDIDSRMRVVGSAAEDSPAAETTTLRRILHGPSVTLQIDLDPQSPRAMPLFWVLGPAVQTVPLRDQLEAYRAMWNTDLPVVDNLCAAFGEESAKAMLRGCAGEPMGTDAALVDASACPICLSADLDGVLPTHSCDNPTCGRVFHESCLYEWLCTAAANAAAAEPAESSSQAANAAAAFNGSNTLGAVFGKCPNCGHRIKVAAPREQLEKPR